MPSEKTIKAYARATTVLDRAMGGLTPSQFDHCCEKPVDTFTQLYLQATKRGILSSTDEDIISACLNEVDEVDIHNATPLPVPLQGVWQLEFFHWREVFTPEQAAEELGITRQRISQLISDGKLEAMKVGKRYFISGASVNRRKRDME